MKYKANTTLERVLDRVNASTINTMNGTSTQFYTTLTSPRKLN